MLNAALFQSLRLAGNFSQANSAFSSFIDALRSQAAKLQITVEDTDEHTAPNILTLSLHEPDGISFQLVVTAPVVEGQVCTEAQLQALTGLVSVHSRSLDRIATLGVNYISIAGAALVVQQLFAGLIGRHRGMPGQSATFDLAQAGLLAIGQYLAGATTEQGAEQFTFGEANPEQRPPFISKDGTVFELESLNPKLWHAFWQQLGLNAKDIGQGWHAFMQRYAKAVAPLPETMPALLRQYDYSYLVRLAAESGVAITPVRTLQARTEDADIERVLRAGPWRFSSGQERSVSPRALPPYLESEALPLSGIQVVESCRRIQGPLAGHILSALGARVTRIEPQGGDPLRGMPPLAEDCSVRFTALNGHKQVTEINIKSDDGKTQIAALSREADVFMHNWAPGKADELGLNMAVLNQVNPELVYVYAGGWGELDDTMQLPGTDFMVQAYSGLADLISQHTGTPGGTLFTATDVFGGILSAQATVIALYCRAKGQSGMYVESSLLGAATLLTEPALAGQISDLSLPATSSCRPLRSLSTASETEALLESGVFTQLKSLWRPL